MASTIHPLVQDLLTRDAASVAGVEKLRFFPLVAESGKALFWSSREVANFWTFPAAGQQVDLVMGTRQLPKP